ncbi:SIR2 family protein [Rhizobium fabae]|uniref:SIR2 family protein n=1 Tax=Rhizobium fabae TaxID=573179 RepID=A0A7W6BGE7_9HYPH|nr:SIR2 family protein [Rhizobium fabae]MBB3918662.1 hypothetical protein [Rhizobium fabae]
MIRDFKAQIFCRENKLSKREIDTGDPVWIDRIDAFFRRTSLLPPDGDPTEYAAAFEAVYPQARHRRQYIDDAISKGSPCFGQKVLASLIAGGKADCVFTTNFDPLIEDATLSANALRPVAMQRRPTVAGIDSAERALRCLNESDWPLVAKLHGDYQEISIKNTGSELEKQDERMRHVLVEASKRFGMVFVGYSGRDASVMDALSSVLTERSPFPNGLYWMTSSASRLLPAVTEFLTRAQEAGVDVAVIECATFDELAADVIRAIDLPNELHDHIMKARPNSRLIPVTIPTSEARAFPVLRYSALLVEALPSHARKIVLGQSTTSPAVRELLKAAKSRAIIAANGREIAAFGNDQEMLKALSSLNPKLAGTVALDPEADSWALGILYDALVTAFSRWRPLTPRLRRSGHSLTVSSPREGEDEQRRRRRTETLKPLRDAYQSLLTGSVPGLGFPFSEGILLKLEQIDGRWWCGFEPYTHVDIPRLAPPAGTGNVAGEPSLDPLSVPRERHGGDPAGDWRRERWAQRYNKQWAAIIHAWAGLLTRSADGETKAFGLEDGAGVDAVFRLNEVTGWSRPSHHHRYFDRKK